jgi:hypothetical protein
VIAPGRGEFCRNAATTRFTLTEDDIVTNRTRALLAVLPLAMAGGLLFACGSDETAAPPDHTPTTYSLIINGVPQEAPYSIQASHQVVVQIKFFNAAGEDLDAVEAEHFGGLSLNPTSLGTVTPLTDHHYQFNLTTSATPGSGTLTVSFGHDEAADEVTFDPAPFTVTGGGQN